MQGGLILQLINNQTVKIVLKLHLTIVGLKFSIVLIVSVLHL
jgi:hypothetical protein